MRSYVRCTAARDVHNRTVPGTQKRTSRVKCFLHVCRQMYEHKVRVCFNDLDPAATCTASVYLQMLTNTDPLGSIHTRCFRSLNFHDDVAGPIGSIARGK